MSESVALDCAAAMGRHSVGPRPAWRRAAAPLLLLVVWAPAALAATQIPAEARELLSEDGFGICVPEDNLDGIWMTFAKFAKGDRVPHVCMRGDCEDLPDIAEWAAAQQYPDDIDLDRDDVQAHYGRFVAELCSSPQAPMLPPQARPTAPPDSPDPDTPEPDTPATATPAEPPASLPDEPRLHRGLPPLLTPTGGTPPSIGGRPPGAAPPAFLPPGSSRPPARTPPLDSSDFEWPWPDTPTRLLVDSSHWEAPMPRPDDTPPTAPVPLPAGGWLLLSALGAGLWAGRRWRRSAPLPGRSEA